MFYLIELGLYALVGGALVGLISGEMIGILYGIIGGIVYWIFYWVLNRLWLGGNFMIKGAILFSGGFLGTLLILFIGDMIRLLAFQLYKGDQIIPFVFFGIKTKWEAEVDASPEVCVNCTEKHKLQVHRTRVIHLDYSQDGQMLISRSEDGEVAILNTEDGKLLSVAKAPNALSSDRSLIAQLDREGQIGVYRVGDPTPLLTLQLPGRVISRLAIAASGGMIAAGTSSNQFAVWSLPEGELLYMTELPEVAPISGMAFSPDNTLFATASSKGLIYLWNANTGQLIRTIPEKKHWGDSSVPFTDLQFAPDSQVLAANQKTGISNCGVFWRVADGKKLNSLYNSSNIEFYQGDDGSYFGVGTWSAPSQVPQVRIWEPGDKPRIRTLKGASASMACVSITPDWKTLVTGDFNKLKLWDFRTGKKVKEQRVAANDVVKVLAVSPVGNLLAACAEFGIHRLFRLPNLALAGSVYSLNREISRLSFSPDGKTLASGAVDGSIWTWSLS